VSSSGRHVWLALAVALAVAAATLPGCGDDEGGKPRLTVSAASSLKLAFQGYGEQFPSARARFSFAGSDELAAQIRQGVKPDLYAAANVELPGQLYRQGRLERPVTFAANRLVIAVPAGSRDVRSVSDLGGPGVKLAVGSASVPVGSYTRKVLDRLPAGTREAILANVRSNEPDVAGVVGKLAQGAADAGFVYVTDVAGARGKLDAVELPRRLRPKVAYAAAVVRGATHPREARAFLAGLLAGNGAAALRRAGFDPPPH
jgi:molybdate transport system substrate-binding protein